MSLLFQELGSYAKKVSRNQSFRSGDNFIEVNESADSVTFDLANNDQVLLRFERDKVLVQTTISRKVTRKVLTVSQVPAYLAHFNIDVMRIAKTIPYLHKILARNLG